MRYAMERDPTALLEVAISDVLHGGDWVGEKKEIINYTAKIRHPDMVPVLKHEKIIEMLDDWHGEGHYDTTTQWTFPEEIRTNLTGEIVPNDNTGEYFERLTTPENQLSSIVDKINQWGRVNRACAQVFQVDSDLNAMFPPCLMTIQALYRDDKLHLTAYFRSHTIAKSYYGDIIALTRMQSWIADKVECDVGELVVHSGSLHARKKNDEYELLKKMEEELI